MSHLSSYQGLILIRSYALGIPPAERGSRAKPQLSEVIKRQGEVVKDSSSVACHVYTTSWTPPAQQRYGMAALSRILSIWEEKQLKGHLEVQREEREMVRRKYSMSSATQQ